MTPLGGRVEALRARIARACEAAGRDPVSVDLLPVSKKQPIELIDEAAALGFSRFGENYVQEGAAKAGARPGLAFTLLGPLQRNKARQALQTFTEIQSVDRVELVQRLGRLAEELDLRRPVWIQVDLWNESSKVGGCSRNALPALFEAVKASPRLPLKGLMAIPPPETPGAFTQLSLLRDSLQQRLGLPLELSMGMSGDLEAAVAAGSTQVRVGTAFFGERTR
ncbi:MAG: YggS family pyridoxal phosphate-dependent enzyme [Acidobacteriota bacterium]|nr:YggS family pyridoxal phosphate-dependent enzyme [Acidobacteriota bacterium]